MRHSSICNSKSSSLVVPVAFRATGMAGWLVGAYGLASSARRATFLRFLLRSTLLRFERLFLIVCGTSLWFWWSASHLVRSTSLLRSLSKLGFSLKILRKYPAVVSLRAAPLLFGPELAWVFFFAMIYILG